MKIRSIVAFIFGAVVAILLVAGGAVFFLRFQILQYSADAVIRKILPEYVEVDRITLEPAMNKFVLKGFRILNPPGFSSKYLLEADEIVTGYKAKGKNILDGITILEPVFRKPVLTIERLADGSLNLARMPAFMREAADRRQVNEGTTTPQKETKAEEKIDKRLQALIGDRTVADMVTLPETFVVKEGRLVFVDKEGERQLRRPHEPYVISIDKIEALMSLKLDASFTNVLRAGSEGQGILNDRRDEVVKWNSVYDPTTPRLTMANRFEVKGADIMALKPYYDRFSPIDFQRGNFTGTIVIDFDNGSIGAVSEVRLENLAFSVKEGMGSDALWDASANEIAKYFTGPSGEVIFDFKIKGDMTKPKFMLGPISKQAMMAMAIDKVGPVIIKKIFSQTQDTAESAVGAVVPDKSDADKTMELIGAISDLMTKKKE